MERASEVVQKRFGAAVGAEPLHRDFVRHGTHIEDIAVFAVSHVTAEQVA